MSDEVQIPDSNALRAAGVPQDVVARFDALEDLFQSDGWQFLKQDMQTEWERLGDVDRLETEVQLQCAKAQREILYGLIHFDAALTMMKINAERAALAMRDNDDAE